MINCPSLTCICVLSIILIRSSVASAQNQVSPDGQQLVSYEKVGNQTDIYIQPWNGDKTYITASEYFDYNPQWLADGSGVIFYRKHPEKDISEIYRYSLKDNKEFKILGSGFYDSDPTVDPVGQLLAFTSNRDGDHEIFVMELPEGKQRQMTSNQSNDWSPNFSPNGMITFVSDRGGNFELYAINKDGSGLEQLTQLGGENYKPDWSPDGRWIGFFHRDDIDSKFDVILLEVGSKQMKNITNTPNQNEFTCGWFGSEFFYYSETGIEAYNTRDGSKRKIQED